jgi:hypothetical protein
MVYMPRGKTTQKIKAEQSNNPIKFQPVNLPPNITQPIPKQERDEAIEHTWYGNPTGGLTGKFRAIRTKGRETSVAEIV